MREAGGMDEVWRRKMKKDGKDGEEEGEGKGGNELSC